MRAVLSEDEVTRIKTQFAHLQAEVHRLRAENAAIRAAAKGLTWCTHCNGLCPTTRRWRKYCSDDCRRTSYNAIRRARYSHARDLGIPGRQAAQYSRTWKTQ